MNFTYKIFSGRLSERLEDDQFRVPYLSAYNVFHSVWEETFKSLSGDSFRQYSDDFTRQDQIQGLFHGDECIALNCIREVSLRNPVDLKDSWLNDWPKDKIESLAQEYSKALINSYFTVHPRYRKTQNPSDLNPSYILGCLTVIHQMEVKYPLMLGMMRNDRSMNKLGSLWGCLNLDTVLHNNIPTDIVVFTPETILEARKKFPNQIEQIYKNKIDFTERTYNEQRKRVA